MSALLDVLKKYWKYDSFRSVQQEIVQSVFNNIDTLALLPTGGGKSVCFQVPVMAKEGTCIVICPLIALMKDQVEQLQKKQISAIYLDASYHQKETEIILQNAINQEYKFIYISPEKLKNEQFLKSLLKIQVCLIAIDEAHCISQWGYTFRPSYLEINILRKHLPKVPFVALTASATEKVKLDIIQKLELRNPAVFAKSFRRNNLSYSVNLAENKLQRCYEILKKVNGSAIIYVRSRSRTSIFADWLNKAGIKAEFYHAGLTQIERSKKQELWMKNQTRVIVATNAFGMGIDKSDVRLVINIDTPDSLEAYYQEAGRAGRDEKNAFAVLLYQNQDLIELENSLEIKFPLIETIKNCYQQLANYFQIATGSEQMVLKDFDIEQFCTTYSLHPKTTYNCIKLLEKEGLILFEESFFSPTKIHVPDRTLLYQFQVANAKYDPIIKTLLRAVGGSVFTDFVKINESQLASKMNTDVASLAKILLFLNDAMILIYQAQKTKPQLAFLTQRYAAKNLPFDIKKYDFLKATEKQKNEAIIAYIKNQKRCRNIQISEYFDDISDIRCGICDNCIQYKKTQFALEIAEEIMHRIDDADIKSDDLPAIFPNSKPNEIANWLREQFDKGILFLDDKDYIRKQIAK